MVGISGLLERRLRLPAISLLVDTLWRDRTGSTAPRGYGGGALLYARTAACRAAQPSNLRFGHLSTEAFDVEIGAGVLEECERIDVVKSRWVGARRGRPVFDGNARLDGWD